MALRPYGCARFNKSLTPKASNSTLHPLCPKPLLPKHSQNPVFKNQNLKIAYSHPESLSASKPEPFAGPGLWVQGFGGITRTTWRFMGSYKWSYKSYYKSPIWDISIVTLLITPLITTHEPPSLQRNAFKS